MTCGHIPNTVCEGNPQSDVTTISDVRAKRCVPPRENDFWTKQRFRYCKYVNISRYTVASVFVLVSKFFIFKSSFFGIYLIKIYSFLDEIWWETYFQDCGNLLKKVKFWKILLSKQDHTHAWDFLTRYILRITNPPENLVRIDSILTKLEQIVILHIHLFISLVFVRGPTSWPPKFWDFEMLVNLGYLGMYRVYRNRWYTKIG